MDTDGKKTRRTPAEQAEYFYGRRKLHVVMFAASGLMLASFLWMFWDDYDREWKDFQRVAQDMKLSRLSARLAEAAAALEQRKDELEKIDAAIADFRAKLGEGFRKVEVSVLDPATRLPTGEKKTMEVDCKALVREAQEKQGLYERLTLEKNFRVADLQVLRYEYDEARRRGEGVESAAEKYEAAVAASEEAKRKFDEVDVRLCRIKNIVDVLEADISDLKAKRARITKELDLLKRRFEKERPSFQNLVRDLPVLDFFDPSVKVKQVILPAVREDLHFTRVEKVDRCHTCHVNVGNPLYAADAKFRDPYLAAFAEHARGAKKREECAVCAGGKGFEVEPRVEHGSWSEEDEIRYTRALKAHPQLDLYVAAGSPHPLEKFGCTSCHQGDGRDTDFSRCVHTPDGEEEARDWERRNGYHHRELWDHPMYPSRHVYASCRRCHEDDVLLTGGPTDAFNEYSEAMRLMESAGCYACHRIDTHHVLAKEVADPGIDVNRKQRRPGPPLTHVADKVTREFAYQYLRRPKDYRLGTKMPHFFGQSNARALPEGGAKEVDDTIVAAVTDYLFAQSQTRNYPEPPAPPQPADPARGEQSFRQLGCTACHLVTPDAQYPKPAQIGNSDDKYRAPDGTSMYLAEFGPNLGAVGSKVNKKWLYHYLLNPRQYFPDTRMPELRLTPQELSDITAYLMELRNPEWEKTQADKPAVKPEVLDRLILEFLTARMPAWSAEEKMKGMQAADKVGWYGRTVVLQQLGCFSCHELNPDAGIDWPNTEGLGVEMTGSEPIGSKDFGTFDFGLMRYDGVNRLGASFRHEFTGAPYRQVDQRALLPESRDPELVRVPLTRWDFITNKVLNPRLYDGGKMETQVPAALMRMPNFYLNPEEARLLATLLLSYTDHNVKGLLEGVRRPAAEGNTALQRGERLMREGNCRSCHRLSLDRFLVELPDGKGLDWLEGRLDEFTPEQLAMAMEETFDRDPEDVDAGYKVSWATDNRTLKPNPLTKGITALFLKGGRWFTFVYDEDEGEFVERDFPFVRHVPQDGGDIIAGLLDYKRKNLQSFKDPKVREALQANLDDVNRRETQLPPYLRTQGAKTQPQWLFNFLKAPTVIRPNLAEMADVNVRMPTYVFTDEEASSLVRYFDVRDALEGEDAYPHVSIPQKDPAYAAAHKERLAWAKTSKEVFGDLCLQCHYVNGVRPAAAPGEEYKLAPEVFLTKDRLRPRWLRYWMEDPMLIYPKTNMVGVVISERPQDGLDGVVDYLMNIHLDPPPSKK